MYVKTGKYDDPIQVHVAEMPEVKMDSQDAREVLAPENLRGIVDDIEDIAEMNQRWKRIAEENDSGRPGHYWGKDVMLEGQMPMAAFLLAPLEYGDNVDWWRDDKLFNDFMNRNPIYN